MTLELEVGCVFNLSWDTGKRVVLKIYSDEEGGYVDYAFLDRSDQFSKGYARIRNMIPAGKLTVEEMLTSSNPFVRELGLTLV